ncbi:hypothetical protein BHM03_00008032 [Ensete ventricosum]|nr:hypothetical protein BHM03_00008032 [Ensete ventricosum]
MNITNHLVSPVPVLLSTVIGEHGYREEWAMAEAATENGVRKAASPEEEHPRKAFGWAARDASGIFSPFAFSRRHEIVGVVTQVGRSVQKFQVGDRVGVGCMVNSCGSCHGCDQGFENYCPGLVFTYNSVNLDGTMTYGGYSDMIVVDQHFVIRFPDNMPSDRGAPLLCAGITVYAPMKYHGLDQPGKHLGVVGLGGLGHVAVRFGKAFGMKVTVISSSPSKEKEATERLGADAFLKSIAGTCIGGVKATQEMIDFAADHNITADIELISIDRVNEAMERLGKGDVRYRFVIDIGNTLTAA